MFLEQIGLLDLQQLELQFFQPLLILLSPKLKAEVCIFELRGRVIFWLCSA